MKIVDDVLIMNHQIWSLWSADVRAAIREKVNFIILYDIDLATVYAAFKNQEWKQFHKLIQFEEFLKQSKEEGKISNIDWKFLNK